MKRVLTYVVERPYDGKELKMVLRDRYKMSTTLIKELKNQEDGFLINGGHIRIVDTVKAGDTLTITMRDKPSKNIEPVNIPLDIVYEDEDILIVNKAPDMPTHISIGNYNNSLANALMYHYKKEGEEHLFRAVNRLDKDTSGLMAVAKNSYAHARMAEGIKTGTLKRKYMCIVCGDTKTGGVVDAPIGRKDGSAIERVVREDGQRAVTRYSVIERYGDFTLLEMELETGRTHQIRVHMAYIGHPLAGDWLYGTEDKDFVPRQMLHSSYIEFLHPVTGERLSFNVMPPQDFCDFIDKVKN